MQSEDTARTQDWRHAVARSLGYRLLSRIVAYPTVEQLDHLEGDLVPDVATAGPDVAPLLAPIAPLTATPFPSLDELRRRHAQIFSHTVSPDCPDYETAYEYADIFRQTQTMADVAGFYRAWGLAAGGTTKERPDHIAVELEFMSFLALREAYALDRGEEPAVVEVCREAQRCFLRDHLARWAPALGVRVAARAGDLAPYGAAGRSLAAWIAADCRRLAVDDVTPYDEPRVPAPEVDEDECGAGACPLIAPDEIPVR